MTGGQVGITGDNQDNVWIDNIMLESGNSSWKEGPRMNEGRYYHGCIALHYQEKIYIVVAGGRTSRTDTLKSVEILDPNTNKWVPGENIATNIILETNQISFKGQQLSIKCFL